MQESVCCHLGVCVLDDVIHYHLFYSRDSTGTRTQFETSFVICTGTQFVHLISISGRNWPPAVTISNSQAIITITTPENGFFFWSVTDYFKIITINLNSNRISKSVHLWNDGSMVLKPYTFCQYFKTIHYEKEKEKNNLKAYAFR